MEMVIGKRIDAMLHVYPPKPWRRQALPVLRSPARRDEGWMPYAILMISLFIDESITLSPCPLISPSLRLNRMANFLMDDTLGLFIF